MIRLAARRLAAAASLAAGVALVVFLIFDSGLAGDPALREAGRHPNPESIAAARQRLGYFRDYRAGALELRIEGPPARFALEVAGAEELVLRDARGQELGRVMLAGRHVGEVAELLPLPAGWSLAATTPEPALAAGGLAVALRGGSASLAPGRPLALGWAAAVPAAERFLRQTAGLFVLDFGRGRDGRPVAAELWTRGRRSLALALPAFLLTTALALAAALFAATRRGWADRLLGWASVAGMSISSLVWVLVLQRWLAKDLGWFPVYGWQAPFASYLALPVLIWVLVGWGPELRFYRAAAMQELGRPYLLTARAKGCGGGRVLRRHLLPNLAVPVLTQVLVALPFLFLGSLLLERFFGIPGLGDGMVRAVMDGDRAMVRATTFLLALLYLAAQWLTDLAYAWADPRLRRER